jgi:hypothetical protein
LVKWTKWNPKSIGDLESFIRRGCDWGVKTGNDFVVLDFDALPVYESFMAANLGKLPLNTPIVKTGRCYHVWLQTTKPVKTQHFEGLDIKAEGGYVVCPPSIHANGNQYTFVRALGEEIPVVNFESLILPCVKPSYETRPATTFNPTEWRPVAIGHKADIINNGAAEGERHNGLVSKIGILINEGRGKEWIAEEAKGWNEMCRPPLPDEEVQATIESMLKSYFNRVSTKTHINNYSVLVETRRAEKEKAEARQKLIEELKAKEKATEFPHDEMCGKHHAISRQGKKYLSVAFFCGSWSCPRCADYFRRRWIKHLQEVTNGCTLFITNFEYSDWGRLRRSLNRLGSDYIRISTFEQNTLITNKPIPGCVPILEGQLVDRLEALIPHTFMFSPISTSRGWQLEKKVKDPEKEKATLVTRTFLPIDLQQFIAKKLGAKPDGDYRWVSPENEDAQEWADKFSTELFLHERHLMSETAKKGQSLGKWIDNFNDVMEADNVFGGRREWWEGRAG